MKTLANVEKRISLDVSQSLLYYKSHGSDKKDWPPSGAYVFRPNSSNTYPLVDNVEISVAQVNGFVCRSSGTLSEVNNNKNNNKSCCGIILCFSIKNDISKFSFYMNEISLKIYLLYMKG